MAKLGCRCGHVLSNVSDASLRFTAEILRSNDYLSALEHIVRELTLYGAAKEAGTLEEWASRHFPENYLYDFGEEGLLFDFISGELGLYTLVGYECESCGRLIIQESTDSQNFLPYTPDSGTSHRVFGLERERRPVQRSRAPRGVWTSLTALLRSAFRQRFVK